MWFDLIWFDTPRLFASVIDCPVWVYRTYLLAYVYSSSNSLFSNPSGIYLPRVFIEMEDTNLDASLFVGPALDSAWSQRCDDLRRAVDRMRNISSQKALILLRASFSAPCMLYVQGPPCARKLEALARTTIGKPSGSKFPNVSIFKKFLNVLACHFHEDLFWYCTRLDSNMLIPNDLVCHYQHIKVVQSLLWGRDWGMMVVPFPSSQNKQMFLTVQKNCPK